MYIVDRIEGKFVVCEGPEKKMYDFSLDCFPKEIKAGDIVIKVEEHFIIDQAATKERTKKIKSLMDSLWE